jgi:hypothetical protein
VTELEAMCCATSDTVSTLAEGRAPANSRAA